MMLTIFIEQLISYYTLGAFVVSSIVAYAVFRALTQKRITDLEASNFENKEKLKELDIKFDKKIESLEKQHNNTNLALARIEKDNEAIKETNKQLIAKSDSMNEKLNTIHLDTHKTKGQIEGLFVLIKEHFEK